MSSMFVTMDNCSGLVFNYECKCEKGYVGLRLVRGSEGFVPPSTAGGPDYQVPCSACKGVSLKIAHCSSMIIENYTGEYVAPLPLTVEEAALALPTKEKLHLYKLLYADGCRIN